MTSPGWGSYRGTVKYVGALAPPVWVVEDRPTSSTTPEDHIIMVNCPDCQRSLHIQGMTAAAQGEGLSACDHKPGTAEQKEWVKGWQSIAARQAYRERVAPHPVGPLTWPPDIHPLWRQSEDAD